MLLNNADRSTVSLILSAIVPAGFRVSAFGSRVHGRNYKAHSDLDLCVKGDKPLPEDIMQKLRESFSESDLPFKVDVVDWWQISDEFQRRITDDLEVIDI